MVILYLAGFELMQTTSVFLNKTEYQLPKYKIFKIFKKNLKNL